MDDLSGALSQLLSNKDSLNNIMSLVGSLMNSSKSTEASGQSNQAPALPAISVPQDNSTASDSGNIISELLKTASGKQENVSDSAGSAPADSGNSMDFAGALSGLSKIIGGLGGASGSGGEHPDKAGLLVALKPYLRSERASQIDRAVSMLNTAYTVRTAMKTLGGMKLS